MLWIRKSREPWLVLIPHGIVKADWGLDVVAWERLKLPPLAGPRKEVAPCLVAWEALRTVPPAELAGPAKGERPNLRAVG